MKKYQVTAVDDLGPKWMLGTYLGASSDLTGGHIILKANDQFLQTLNVQLGEEPPKIDESSPPYFVDGDGLSLPIRRIRQKTGLLSFRPEIEPGDPIFPSNSTAPSPGEATETKAEPGGPIFSSSSTAPSSGESLLHQVQSIVVSLEAIRAMIDLASLRASLANDKIETLIQLGWVWEEHYGFDVDNIEEYESLKFHLWSEKQNIWRGVEEEHDHVFLDCPLSLYRSRDRVTDAWARMKKNRRSPNKHRYIFWFMEYDDRGAEYNRIWYIQGMEQKRYITLPYAKMGEDPELVGEYELDADPSPEEEAEFISSSPPIRKRSAATLAVGLGAFSSAGGGAVSSKSPPWKKPMGNAKSPPWKKFAATRIKVKPIRKTDTDLMYRFFTPEEAAECMRSQHRPGWPDEWNRNRLDDPICPTYHLWSQRDAIYSDTQEGYHIRVQFKCEIQMS